MCRKLGCDTAAVALGSGHALMQCRQLGHVLGLCGCEPVVRGGEFGNAPIEALPKLGFAHFVRWCASGIDPEEALGCDKVQRIIKRQNDGTEVTGGAPATAAPP